jgi:hypothetical protein
MCLRYAALERRLGEIDRARAIYVHASSLADPRTDPGFWADWNDFEVKHGNEDTFRCGCSTIAVALAASVSDVCGYSSWSCSLLKAARQVYVQGLMASPWNVMLEGRGLLCREMLRIKRSVAASFSQVHYNTTIVEATTAAGTAGMACRSVTLRLSVL